MQYLVNLLIIQIQIDYDNLDLLKKSQINNQSNESIFKNHQRRNEINFQKCYKLTTRQDKASIKRLNVIRGTKLKILVKVD